MKLIAIIFIICVAISSTFGEYNRSQERIATIMTQPCTIEGNTK